MYRNGEVALTAFFFLSFRAFARSGINHDHTSLINRAENATGSL